MKKLKFRRPDDAWFEFRFSYFFKGEWSKKQEAEYAELVAQEMFRNVEFKPWLKENKKLEYFRNNLGLTFEVNQEAQAVDIKVEGEYL